MHIPDGFLDPKTWITVDILSAGWMAYTIKWVQRRIKEENIPLIGVIAAFIFVAQMINFPIIGGTTGHLLGAVLAVIILGPFSASIVMSSILIIQSLIFQDGGLLVLGANIMNMGIVAVWVGHGVYKLVSYIIKDHNNFMIPVFLASWSSIVCAAASCGLMLSISGTLPLALSITAMAGAYAIIGIIEGLITCSILGFVIKIRPDLLEKHKV